MPASGRPGGSTPEGGQVGDGAGHQPLAAGLVDRRRAAARGPRRRARRARRTARWPARPDRRRRRPGHARGTRPADSAGSGGQGGVLDPDPHGQQDRVEHREDDRGDPGGVHQRQRDALDDDRDVVGVRAGTGTGPACTGASPGTTITRVFHRAAEGGDAPPAQRLRREHQRPASTRRAARRNVGARVPRPRPARRPAARCAARTIERVVPETGLDAAALERTRRRCAWRRRARRAARAPTRATRTVKAARLVTADARRPSPVARSSTSSEQKPGPMASSTP